MLLTEAISICSGCGGLILNEATRALLNIGKQSKKSKLGKELGAYSFDMLAGHDCPGAGMCYRQVVEVPGKKSAQGYPATTIVKCPPGRDPAKWDEKFRQGKKGFGCFGAHLEVKPGVRKSHKQNSDVINSMIKAGAEPDEMADVIESSINSQVSREAKYFRIHAIGGDFKNIRYLKAWMKVAERMPDIFFYTYTHMPMFFIKSKNFGMPYNTIGDWSELILPDNMRIVLSADGGAFDDMVYKYAEIPQEKRMYKVAYVVFSKEEAKNMGLDIDHADTIAVSGDRDFALWEHKAKTQQISAAKRKRDKKRKERKENASD